MQALGITVFYSMRSLGYVTFLFLYPCWNIQRHFRVNRDGDHTHDWNIITLILNLLILEIWGVMVQKMQLRKWYWTVYGSTPVWMQLSYVLEYFSIRNPHYGEIGLPVSQLVGLLDRISSFNKKKTRLEWFLWPHTKLNGLSSKSSLSSQACVEMWIFM